jgi:transforming growth factor-beta-induced protein
LIDTVLLPVNPFRLAAPTAAAAASSTPALSTLVSALRRTNLVGAFGPDFNGTAYAPTNEAFAALLKALRLPNLEAVPLNVLIKVLRYHVTPAYRPASLHVGNTRVNTSLTGETLFFFYDRRSGAGPFIRDSNPNSRVNIIAANVYAGKGVVHVIDKVLLPK